MGRPDPPQPRAPRLRLAWATGLGSGYAPLIPGTFGSLVGVAIFVIAVTVAGTAGGVGVTVAATLLGFATCGVAARHIGEEDPGRVVADEIAGQMVALLFLPPLATTWLAGFLLFRLFDVLKPWPANRLERLPGAAGIMCDDLMAGIYANVVLRVGYAAYGAVAGWG